MLSTQVIQAGFDIAKDDYGVAPNENDGFTVLKVISAEMPNDASLDQNVILQINEAASLDMLTQLVEDLQSRETVIINQSAIEAAFNPYGGGHGGM